MQGGEQRFESTTAGRPPSTTEATTTGTFRGAPVIRTAKLAEIVRQTSARNGLRHAKTFVSLHRRITQQTVISTSSTIHSFAESKETTDVICPQPVLAAR